MYYTRGFLPFIITALGHIRTHLQPLSPLLLPSADRRMEDDRDEAHEPHTAGETISMSVSDDAVRVSPHDNASTGEGEPTNHAKNTNTLASRCRLRRDLAVEYLRRGVRNETIPSVCVASASSKEWDIPLLWLSMTQHALTSIGEERQLGETTTNNCAAVHNIILVSSTFSGLSA